MVSSDCEGRCVPAFRGRSQAGHMGFSEGAGPESTGIEPSGLLGSPHCLLPEQNSGTCLLYLPANMTSSGREAAGASGASHGPTGLEAGSSGSGCTERDKQAQKVSGVNIALS